MTTRIFVENATGYQFQITDLDNNQFGNVNANGYYSLNLNYSQSFDKQYQFRANGASFQLWLSPEGDIQRMSADNHVYLKVGPEEYNTRTQIFPYPLKTSGQVYMNGHVYGSRRNKLLITPIDNIYARSIPEINSFVPDRVTRLDFTG